MKKHTEHKISFTMKEFRKNNKTGKGFKKNKQKSNDRQSKKNEKHNRFYIRKTININ